MEELNNIHKKIEHLNYIFEEFLKPLKNKNARVILYLVNNLKNDYFTTHNIQKILNKNNIELNKKELNGILTLMVKHKLLLKGNKRVKPTTINYSNKYTFEKWEITKEGKIIITNLFNLLLENSLINQNYSKKENYDFKDIEFKYYSYKIFQLFKMNNSISLKKVCRDLRISKDILNSILIFDNEKGTNKIFDKKIEKIKSQNLLFSIFFRKQYDEVISLTNFGEELKKKY